MVLVRFFSLLLDIAEIHDGDVIKFAGDALLLLWPKSRKNALLATKAALEAAALEMRDFSDIPELHDVDICLTLKVGIGIGKTFAIQVGSFEGRKEFLIAGPSLQDMANAIDVAPASSVIISADVWEYLSSKHSDIFVTKELPSGNYQVERMMPVDVTDMLAKSVPRYDLNEQSIEYLAGFIPKIIRDRLLAGVIPSHLSEIRKVTVVFIGLDIDSNRREVAQTLQSSMAHTVQVLERYGGSMRQFLVDDKGTVIIAVFGLLASEEDPARAVKSAQELYIYHESKGIKISIGIATGRAYCGMIGASTRGEYAIVGDTVNLSARLMGYAAKEFKFQLEKLLEKRRKPNMSLSSSMQMNSPYSPDALQRMEKAILVDEETHKGAITASEFIRLDPIILKGKSHPVIVYSPVKKSLQGRRLQRQHSYSKKLVGREKEQEIFKEIVDEMQKEGRSFHGKLLVLHGQPGSGKSLLINKFSLDCRRAGHVIKVRGSSIDSNSPYYIISQLVLKICELNTSRGFNLKDELVKFLTTSCQLESDREEKVCEESFTELFPLLNDILPLGFEETETTRNMERSIRKEKTHELLLKLFMRAIHNRSEPLFIVVEDYHWSDPIGASFLTKFAKLLPTIPVLMAVTSRIIFPQDPLHFHFSNLQNLSHCQDFILGTMADLEIADIASRTLGGEMSDELAGWIGHS
eukprot:TRINITY_DN7068_c0_g1_i2.p1 TRINITY_DN7068_c0_g1~~TRINITY_DN7068_c0_g1_i2.p1  ORF type:complete len:786 (+),score=242.06 TRINITY_DN7068_c0_g1_i2:284-2359(+)